MKTITKEDIRRGFNNGLVALIADPNKCGGTVCQIGTGTLSNWFYFGGTTADDMTPQEYLQNVPIDDIVDEIISAMEDIRDNLDPDEYEFYVSILHG